MTDKKYLLDIYEKLKTNQGMDKYNITLSTNKMISNTDIIYIVRKGKTTEEKLVYNPKISLDDTPITFCFELQYEKSVFGIIHRILVTPVSYNVKNKEEDDYRWSIGEGQYIQEITFNSINIEKICEYIINKEKEIIMKNEDKIKYITTNQHYCVNCKQLLGLEQRHRMGLGYL